MVAGFSSDAVLEGRSGQREEVENLSDHVQGLGPVRPDRRLLEFRLEGRFAAEVSHREDHQETGEMLLGDVPGL